MSSDTPPTPPAAEPGPAATPPRTPAVPTEEELLAVAETGTVRRAPKYGAWVVAGVLVGMVVGLVVSLFGGGPAGTELVPEGSGFLPFLDGADAVRTWLVAAGAVVGALVGGCLAVLVDRRSARR